MDRFNQVVNLFRTKWDIFLQTHWNNVPSDDYFRSVDPAFTLAGVIFTPTKRWERICWIVYRWLALYDYMIFMLDAVDHLYYRTDFFSTVWPLIKLFSITQCFVRVVVFRRHYDAIVQSRSFINGKPSSSGDADYDYILRKKLYQRTQMVCCLMHGVIAITATAAPFLIAPKDRILGLPRLMHGMNPWALWTAHYLYIATLFSIWANRNSGPPVLASALLDGYKTELRILSRGIAETVDHVQWILSEQATLLLDVQAKHNDANDDGQEQETAEAQRVAQLLDEFWIDLNKRIRVHAKQHIELLENLQHFKPCVEELFLAIYYTSLILFGGFIYAPVTEGINPAIMVAFISLGAFFVECLWWCTLAESLQDITDTMDQHILSLTILIPYSFAHHSDYVQMRSTLMIMKVNVRRSAQFRCYGIVTISNELFCELFNTAYTVLTFLLNMDH